MKITFLVKASCNWTKISLTFPVTWLWLELEKSAFIDLLRNIIKMSCYTWLHLFFYRNSYNTFIKNKKNNNMCTSVACGLIFLIHKLQMWEKSLVTNSIVGLVLLNGWNCFWVNMQAPETCQKGLRWGIIICRKWHSTVMPCQINMTTLMSHDTPTIEPGPT